MLLNQLSFLGGIRGCDLAKTLPMVEVPLIVCAATSGVTPEGIAMSKALAGQAPNAKFISFEDAGHILFYE